MSERKAINKYYPPDYDPSKLPKQKKKTANQTIKIRMMAPYSMRCTNCNEYIAERRSFNARKETTNERYLNIKIIRFYITCPGCNNTITFRTNPQTSGYVPEQGAVRNYEPTRKVTSDAKVVETEDELLKRLEREEEENKKFQLLKEKRKRNPFWSEREALNAGDGDVMENLEKRLKEQQKQQEINEHLEELQNRLDDVESKGGSDKVAELAKEKVERELELQRENQLKAELDDAELAKLAFENKKRPAPEQSEEVEKEALQGIPPPSKKVHLRKRPVIPSAISIKRKPILQPKNEINLGYSSSSDSE
ncbi:cwf16 [[Candida] subhashii]|uniref:Splicing factor YJU2 n=1 Tax=[Candida] subhashii TaxID=561895 RepID=A0A8J5QIB0_9ASCO|nr:cwf16 [[Candida] subhashii]KAG7661567.1 cwf16 [[Candida] subhashii]